MRRKARKTKARAPWKMKKAEGKIAHPCDNQVDYMKSRRKIKKTKEARREHPEDWQQV